MHDLKDYWLDLCDTSEQKDMSEINYMSWPKSKSTQQILTKKLILK